VHSASQFAEHWAKVHTALKKTSFAAVLAVSCNIHQTFLFIDYLVYEASFTGASFLLTHPSSSEGKKMDPGKL